MNRSFFIRIFQIGNYSRIMAVICMIAMAVTLFGTVSMAKSDPAEITYDTLLFDQSYVHEINVEISEEDWADLCKNPTRETKYSTTITIDGEVFQNVSFKTKGNTSLSSVAMMDSDRYSFKLNFGSMQEGQTYHGLKKLHLANLYADASYLKDYISYEIFQAAGLDGPLTSYVQLSINGEVFGLYLAIEDISGSYLDRTQDGKGELYKPDNGIDNMNDRDRDWEEGDSEGESEGDSRREEAENADGEAEGESSWESAEGEAQAETAEGTEGESSWESAEGEAQAETAEETEGESNWESAEGEAQAEAAEGTESVPSREEWGESDGDSAGEWEEREREEGESEGESGGGFGGFGGNDQGASLSYTDDDISSYSGIFDNAITNVTEEDMQKVVTALKNLSEGNIEEAVDTEALIRYFVAHNFTCNGDSYTGGMLHNYFLYERGGLLTMLPWDYNLAFGQFGGGGGGFDRDGGATGTVNTGIDSPVSGSNESRPMWAWIPANEEYLERYHEVYEELISGYFESGEFEAEMARVYEMIRPYVENDPSAFYNVEEFDTAYNALLQFCLLRAQSIRKQLNGELATITNNQNAADRVDASSVNTSDMGGMNMGRGDSEGDSAGDREESDGDSRRDREAAEDAEAADAASEGGESADSEAAEGTEAAEAAADDVPAQDDAAASEGGESADSEAAEGTEEVEAVADTAAAQGDAASEGVESEGTESEGESADSEAVEAPAEETEVQE